MERANETKTSVGFMRVTCRGCLEIYCIDFRSNQSSQSPKGSFWNTWLTVIKDGFLWLGHALKRQIQKKTSLVPFHVAIRAR